jgi:hypothetical protein
MRDHLIRSVEQLENEGVQPSVLLKRPFNKGLRDVSSILNICDELALSSEKQTFKRELSMVANRDNTLSHRFQAYAADDTCDLQLGALP